MRLFLKLDGMPQTPALASLHEHSLHELVDGTESAREVLQWA